VIRYGDFDAVLDVILSPNSPAAFRFQEWTLSGNRRAAAYAFEIPSSGGPRFGGAGIPFEGAQRVNLSGKLVIDRETHEVLRLSYRGEAVGDNPLRWFTMNADYENAGIGDRSYLLPSRADMQIATWTDNFGSRFTFSNYRKFTADSNVTYK
jgi:hypothetical protein